MTLFNTRLHIFRRRFFIFLGFLCLNLGFHPALVDSAIGLEKRKIGRVQAVYLTHLIDFTNWAVRDLPNSGKPARVLFLGHDQNGVADAFDFLVSEGLVTIGGRKVEVVHRKDVSESFIKNELTDPAQVVFFLEKVNLSNEQIQKLKSKSLIIGLGRESVVKGTTDIAFVFSKNRIRLAVSKQAFVRKSPGLSSRISILRNVVEIIP